MLTTNEILRRGLDSAHLIVEKYLSDMPEEYWKQAPHPACQDLNWQFGHLILSEAKMIADSFNADPMLSDSFRQTYRKPESAVKSPPASQRSNPSQLWEWYGKQRQLSLDLLAPLSNDDLNQPAAPAIRGYCPTIADAYIACTSHWLMHSGQWVILRRMAGLPIVI